MTNSSISEALKQLDNAKKIAVFCHAKPDGDTLGSGLALAAALNNAGKVAVACCDDTIPEKYGFIEGISSVKRDIPKIEFDTFICVDCSDVSRIGVFANAFTSFKGKTINIDHHVSNKKFASCNCVVQCPATCQIVTELLTEGGYEINKEIANFLMLGIITDSGNFSHIDVTGKTFETAALLSNCGANSSNINYEMFLRKTKFKAMLFGKVINEMRFALDDRLALITVKLEYFGGNAVDGSITEGFVDFPLTIDGVEISVSMLEVKKRQYKISFRSNGKVNVNAVAATFGGGGHIFASGCMITGELEEVIEKITYAVYQNI